MTLSIQSEAFQSQGAIPGRHSGDGEDLSPPLSWSGLPPQTRELALIVEDWDAPGAKPWVHWVIYKIAPTETGLAEGVHVKPVPSFPAGCRQGKNSWGTIGYRGPAPPRGHGPHHYRFRLLAIDAPLDVPAGLDRIALLKAMEGHLVGEAELVGTYERK
jgi:Raf kinase inhibitor-like YbhB/YbcL family protein